MPDLILCSSCRRHIRASERACPFCSGSHRAAAPFAVALGALLPLAACATPEPAKPEPPTSTTSTATGTATGTATSGAMRKDPAPQPVNSERASAPAYGGPPVRNDPPVVPTASASSNPSKPDPRMAPAYGGPPPRKP